MVQNPESNKPVSQASPGAYTPDSSIPLVKQLGWVLMSAGRVGLLSAIAQATDATERWYAVRDARRDILDGWASADSEFKEILQQAHDLLVFLENLPQEEWW
jgi:hypothetical protein